MFLYVFKKTSPFEFNVFDFLDEEIIKEQNKVFTIKSEQLDSADIKVWLRLVKMYSDQHLTWIYTGKDIATIYASGDRTKVQKALVKSLPDLNEMINDYKKTKDITYYNEQDVQNFFLSDNPSIHNDNSNTNESTSDYKREMKRQRVNELFFNALYDNDYQTVEEFLRHSINPNIVDKYGIPAIDVACTRGHLNLVETLVKKGANIDYKNKVGNTLLHIASGGGNIDLVKYLIEKNCPINAKSYPDILGNQWTPLDIAIENKQTEIIDLLKQYGAEMCCHKGTSCGLSF